MWQNLYWTCGQNYILNMWSSLQFIFNIWSTLKYIFNVAKSLFFVSDQVYIFNMWSNLQCIFNMWSNLQFSLICGQSFIFSGNGRPLGLQRESQYYKKSESHIALQIVIHYFLPHLYCTAKNGKSIFHLY
jgi:hypothetical protein